MDSNKANGMPLFIEIKQFRNLSKPYQRVTKSSETGKIAMQTMSAKKDATFQLIAHDGVRFLKLILMFPDQVSIIKQLNERNKYALKDAYLDVTTEKGLVNVILDQPDYLVPVYNDKKSDQLKEQVNEIVGLPIKYTNAPRFVFLNQEAKESGEKREEEQADEFADLYKQFDLHDLTGQELVYIKRLQ